MKPCGMPGDNGGLPSVFPLRKDTLQNRNFRTTIWTGPHAQITLMCIPSGGSIGLERHDHLDQVLYIEEGCCSVYLGKNKDRLTCRSPVGMGCAVCVPCGTWHNLVNTGNCPLKLFSVYCPPDHPQGTVHRTKADSDADEHDHT